MASKSSTCEKSSGWGIFGSAKEKETKDNVEYLQKIVNFSGLEITIIILSAKVNTLTETVAEKDMAILEQRKVNKELYRRLEEYNKLVKELNIQLPS